MTRTLDPQTILARAKKATKGPWRFDPSDPAIDGSPAIRSSVGVYATTNVVARPTAPRDAEFIAHAREDIPALLDALDQRDQQIATLTRERDEAQANLTRAIDDGIEAVQQLGREIAQLKEENKQPDTLRALLRILPEDTPPAAVQIEDDGQIDLDWHRGSDAVIAIGLYSSGAVGFSYLVKELNGWGKFEPTREPMPDTLRAAFERWNAIPAEPSFAEAESRGAQRILQMVRALPSPVRYCDGPGDESDWSQCGWCRAVWRVRESHKPGCLWTRAQEDK